MIEPLVRRSGEGARRENYGTIKTTPESIVRIYRLQAARKEPAQMPHICSPARPRIPWHAKIDWRVASNMTALLCSAAVVAVGIYVIIWHIIPFIEALRWG